MKNTGIIRKLDELGRIVIPIEIRNQFNLLEKDQLEIYVKDDTIILKKYEENCIICDNTKNLERFKGKLICSKCKNMFKSIKSCQN